MKLELKHLAPYLPYEIDALMNVFGDTETIVKIVGLDFEFVEIDGIRKTVTEKVEFHQIKPSLRPLSDLTKEIEVNGEKVTPIDYIKQYYLNCSIDENGIVKDDLDEYSLLYLPYSLIQQLIKWRFDVFGLIEKGYAVDINTLNE